MTKGVEVVGMRQAGTPQPGVIARVATDGLCTGCGVCAAICPSGSLTMSLNDDAEFVPVLGEGCTECDLCSGVCPQLSAKDANANGRNPLSAADEAVLGRYAELSTWAGYATDPERRLRSASGGMLTLVLQHLLDSHRIDAAIVVGPANSGRRLLFEAKLARTLRELRACAASNYYPVELSRALRELKSTRERVAVVGLPCHVTAVKRLMEHCKPLRNQILWVFGLVCGHSVSTKFTDLMIAAAGAPAGTVDRVSYREKTGRPRASDFAFAVFRNGRMVGKPVAFEKQ